MISAIVLARREGRPSEDVRELAARSLSWLVSAVVQGVVRDVIVACPPSWPVDDIMGHAGCALVRAQREEDRLGEAAVGAKCPRVLVIEAGYQPEGPLIAEIDAIERRLAADAAALLLAIPSSVLQRLLPDRAPVLGVLAPRGWLLRENPTFANLARRARHGVRLRTRLGPVL